MSEQTPDYVTHAAWVRTIGRVDAIDEVADGFERPVAAGAEAFWTPEAGTPWPRSSRGWRSVARIHPIGTDQRAAS